MAGTSPLFKQIEPVVSLQNIVVSYRAPTEHFATFKEYAIRVVQGKVKHAEFLAVNHISLDIYPGEVFGVIGQNGAGKSTLLKVVARVLPPTEGRVVIKGWIAPLLELGAGFHPELTGRENIYLNGAILGFTRNEVEGYFQEVVDFSELGEFIEAPIRTYSSGMIARLGFASATVRKPDILLVDEILGVGDEAFQEKCTKRIKSFREQGMTILIVSHSMDSIAQMCQRAAWLDHGNLMFLGQPGDVIDAYRASFEKQEN
jgi:ABC-2 type transport system ATP-binding protein/lipopolysaccharide transport system ATP-binding protein